MKTIKILTKECTTKDGRTFTAYKALTRNGTWMDCRFRKELGNLIPTVDSRVTVPDDGANIATNREYPVLWISMIEAVEPLVKDFTAGINEFNELF